METDLFDKIDNKGKTLVANRDPLPELEDVAIVEKENNETLEEIIDKTIEEVKLLEEVDYNFIDEALKEDEEIIKENKTVDFSSDNLKFIRLQYKLLQKANDVISLKNDQSKQLIDLAVLVIDNTKENHKLSTRLDKLALMWTGTGIVIGGVLVYLFPEYLPYLKDGWNFLFNKGS